VVFDTQDKKKLIDKFKLHETDTGSPEVQRFTKKIIIPAGVF
jgi:ribosomal protein S15P/S13E